LATAFCGPALAQLALIQVLLNAPELEIEPLAVQTGAPARAAV
jgi:hypothetical protein